MIIGHVTRKIRERIDHSAVVEFCDVDPILPRTLSRDNCAIFGSTGTVN